jgi:hypothetical protein
MSYLSVMRLRGPDTDGIGPTSHQLDGPRTLRVGQTAYVPVYANRLWNDSGVDVASGQVFTFAVPASEEWSHGRRPCGADGHDSAPFNRRLQTFRRVPKASWLQLICTIGKSGRLSTIIGSNLFGFSPDYRGRLYLFGNDLPWTYWSNRGMIAVRITRNK